MLFLRISSILLLLGSSLSSPSLKIGGSIFGYSSLCQLNNKKNEFKKIIFIRGGEKKKENSDDPIDMSIDDDIILEGDEGNDYTTDEALGGQGRQLFTSVREMWTKTPPMTQVYVGSSLLITLWAYIMNKNQWPKILNLDWTAVITRFQYWRIFTSFLFFGPFGLNYLLTIQFVWTYMAQLEKLNYKEPDDFFMLLAFGASTLLVGYTLLGLSTKFLGHNLSTYLVYIWARKFEGVDVSVMDLFVLRAELLPWFFCAQTMVLEGEIPFADMLGIVVGHLYHYLSQRKMLAAPTVIKNFFSSPEIRDKYNKFKDEFE